MISSTHAQYQERSIGRRSDDRSVREQNHRHRMLFHVGQILTSEMNLDSLFEVIMEETNRIMTSQRSTVFLHDRSAGELWSLVATGMRRNEIRIPETYGVAGWCFQNQTPLIINNAYEDTRFYGEVDKVSGFKTRNILCIPLINRQKERIGALQTLNRLEGDFSEEDLRLLTSLSYYVAIALENAKLYEEIKSLDRAKEKVINHLAHELKTPLSIISFALEFISKDLKDARVDRVGRNIERGMRSLNRLMDLAEKIEDIVAQKPITEGDKIIRLIEETADFLDEQNEGVASGRDEMLGRISSRLRNLYALPTIRVESISLEEFMNEVCDEATTGMGKREVTFRKVFSPGLSLQMDRRVLKKVCSALLKNAIENTPDEGIIEIRTVGAKDATRIEIKDFGVGITSQNREMVFGGFFHTQDTMNYASRKPYQFNAGGAGADLLRAKVFSERLRFSIQFQSTRCRFLPLDTNVCPGVVSECTHIQHASECLQSGGSTFTLRFPLETFPASSSHSG